MTIILVEASEDCECFIKFLAKGKDLDDADKNFRLFADKYFRGNYYYNIVEENIPEEALAKAIEKGNVEDVFTQSLGGISCRQRNCGLLLTHELNDVRSWINPESYQEHEDENKLER